MDTREGEGGEERGRERVGRSVRDFRHLRGVENGPYVSSTRRRPLSPRLSRQTRRGAMAPEDGERGRGRGGEGKLDATYLYGS